MDTCISGLTHKLVVVNIGEKLLIHIDDDDEDDDMLDITVKEKCVIIHHSKDLMELV